MTKMKKLTSVARVFPAGQRTIAVILEYENPIDVKGVEKAFLVKNRKVTDVYVSEKESLTSARAEQGKFIILMLDEKDEAAPTVNSGPPKREMDRKDGPPKGGPKKEKGGEGPGPGTDSPHMKHQYPTVTVEQIENLEDINGEEVLPEGEWVSTHAIQEVVDDFIQLEHNGIPYNLYIPKNMEEGKTYPLVLFMHDAEPCGTDPLLTLVQGIGAIRFAEEESQKKHPCFVLAPEIPLHLRPLEEVCENDIATKMKPILDEVMEKYPVDSKKVYTTGQSGGCMTSCELNHRYPDLFAGSLLVAGQWNPERMRNAAFNKYWICVSEHDVQAFPGMTKMVEAFREEGVEVYQYFCNAKAGKETLNELAKEAISHNTNVIFTVFEGDSVVPEGFPLNPITNHISTWSVAYDIEAIRDWLLEQERSE